MTVYDATGWNALADSEGWATALALLVTLAVSAAVAFGWRERRVAPRGWVTLLALRLAAIAATGLLLAGIERRPLSEQEVRSRVVLLTDRSASMALAAGESPSDPTTRSAATAPAMAELAGLLASQHDVRRAGFDLTVAYQSGAEGNKPTDSGSATRLGSAIERVLSDHSATPLAAIIIASDGGWNAGPDPLAFASASQSRGVPITTLGVGPLREPPSIGLRDLVAPSRAASDDAFRASVTVAINAAAARDGRPPRVTLELRPLGSDGRTGDVAASIDLTISIDQETGNEGGLTGATTDLAGLPAGVYELSAMLQPVGRDADPSDNRLTTRIEFVDQPTRVLLAASGPARDYGFLRDQLYRDDQFTCDVLLQSATGAITQDAGRVLAALPGAADEWEVYDAVVAVDLDWRLVDAAAQQALAEWVSSRGGGLAFVAGPISTPGVVRAGLEPPLRTLLPVTLRDDPLALGSSLGANRDPRAVLLTRAGEELEWLDQRAGGDESSGVWRRLDGLYGAPIPAEAKPGATVLAKLGDAPDAPPLLVEQAYGAGRVAYWATPETWRLRTVDPAAFTAFHVGWLRRLTQGRLLGADAAGSLLFDRRRYDLGEAMTLRYLARNPQSSVPPQAVRVAVADGPPAEMRLTPVEEQPGVYAATMRAEATGRWVATLDLGGGERLTATAEASLPELENETRVQNVTLLRALAELTGGRYVDLAGQHVGESLAQIAQQTPSLAETTVDLGPPDERFAERLSRVALAVMAGSLLLEWLLRRAWRLA